MSTPLKFMAGLGRPVEIPAELQGRSSPRVELVLRRSSAITRPVELAQALKGFGLRLRDAHLALDGIVADQDVTLTLRGDRASLIAKLRELGVSARKAH